MEKYKGKHYYREVKEGVDCIVDENGMFNFGTYNKPIPNINMLDAKRPFRNPAPRWFLNYRLKEWEAFQAGNKDIFIFGAIYSAKVSCLICLIIYDRRNKRLYDYEKIVSTSKISIASGLFGSETIGRTKGYYMKFTNNLREDEIGVRAEMDSTDELPKLVLDIKAHHVTEPIVICQPFGKNRGLYSHKNFMPMEGYLILGDEEIVFEKDDSHMIIDDHKGYYPYNMGYDWVTGWGEDEEGNTFGFNLTDNQILDHERYNENCIWIDGKMKVLPPIKVDRKYGDEEVWKIKDNYDMVNIRFYPETKTEIKFNCLVICSDYEAPIGRHEGYFEIDDKRFILKDFFGMGEKKRIRI
jgi:hypothetical protein